MKAITEWKDNIQKYADVIVSKPFKIFMTVVLLSFASMFLYIKFGAGAIVKFLSWIFE